MSAGEWGGNAGVAQPPTFFPMKRPAACIPKPKEETKKPKADTKDTNQLTADNVEQFKDQPLDQKLELYRSWASKQIDAGQLDYQLLNKVLRQLMDQNNMSALWSRLKTSLKKTGSKQVREAWEKICDKGMREGKTDKKSEVLCINLALGSDTDKNWEDYLSEEFLSLAQVDKVASTGEWMYYGALEKKHGKEELDDIIKTGKMDTTTDRWGDTMYHRKRIITSSEQIREHRATISKKVKTNTTAHDKNTTALDTFAKARGIIGTTTGVDASGSQPDAEEKDPKATAKKDDQDENEGYGDGDAEGGEQPGNDGDGEEVDGDEAGGEQTEQAPKPPKNQVDSFAKQLTDKMGSVIRCVELLKGKSLAKAIRDKLSHYQDRIPTLAKEMLRLGSAKKPDDKEIKKKVKEAEKMLADIKELLSVARPHIQKKGTTE